MNTQKQALKRLLKIVEDGVEKYPMLEYLIKNRCDTVPNPHFYDGLVGYKKNRWILFLQRTFLIVSLSTFFFIIFYSPFFWISIGLLSFYFYLSIEYKTVINSYKYIHNSLPMYLEKLKMFEYHLGFIVNHSPDRKAINAWSMDVNAVDELKKIADKLLMNNAKEIIIAEDILVHLHEKYHPSPSYIDLHNHITIWIRKRRELFRILHYDLRLYDLVEEEWDRFYELAKRELMEHDLPMTKIYK